MPTRIQVDREKIAAFCRAHHIRRLSLYGSVLRDDFRPDSDVDVLVTFAPDAGWGLLALERMERELTSMFGRKVDLVERRGIEQSPNYIRRKHVLNSLEPVYVAG